MDEKKDIKKFIQICKLLNLSTSISNLQDRIRIQKIFYILKKFGLYLNFKFNWYKHGPYSPYLAEIYYQLDENSSSEDYDANLLYDKEIKFLNKAKELLNPIINKPELLELYASVLFIKDDMVFFKSEKNNEVIEKKVAELKSDIYKSDKYKNALIFLKNFENKINN